MHIYLCVHADARELGRSPARMGGGGGAGGRAGAGAGAGAGGASRGLPEARQGSPRRRPAGRSSGFLEAKCGGARGPRGGTPGLQRESVPWPPTPRRGWGPGAQELGRGGGG